MLNSMLPLSMLNWCRSYSFDDNIFEVDVPVFDVSYFLQIYLRLKTFLRAFSTFQFIFKELT